MSDLTSRVQILEGQVKQLLALGSVSLSGINTMKGRLFLSQDPQGSLEAATMHYVDAKTGGFTGTVVLAKLTSGGTVGSLTIVNGNVAPSGYTPPT
jgi:hypothetical protein